jgi:hypothetical protein
VKKLSKVSTDGRSPTRGGSYTVIRRRFNALDCFAYMVRDQEVSHLVPVGWGRRLQRIEGKSLILVLVVSVLTAPTDSCRNVCLLCRNGLCEAVSLFFDLGILCENEKRVRT